MAPRPGDSRTAPPADRAEYWRLDCVPGVLFFRARFCRHAYVRHTHDDYAIGAIEEGTQTFWCRGMQRVTPRLGMPCVNPDEAHDGKSFTQAGYRYRMVYVTPELFLRAVREASPRHAGTIWLREPMLEDPRLAGRFLELHAAAQEAAGSACPLELQSRLLEFLIALAERNTYGWSAPPIVPRDRGRVQRALEMLHGEYGRRITLDELAAAAGTSPFHFLRMFRDAVGMPPHAYLCQLRVRAGRRMALDGVPLAAAARAAGFADQSHFTHRFRRTYGVSPAAYVRAVQG
jgi:AraC-like DNA-binding protein